MSPRIRFGLLALCGAGALAAALLAWPSRAASSPPCVEPDILIVKSEGRLELYCNKTLRAAMPATFGANPTGHKEREGDERTPEGEYRVTSKVVDTRFHRFLGISYPNERDRARAHRLGLRPGGGIGIHGTRTRLAAMARAWTRLASASGLAGVWGPTDGCIGIANEHAELLYDLVPIGTRVTITARRLPR